MPPAKSRRALLQQCGGLMLAGAAPRLLSPLSQRIPSVSAWPPAIRFRMGSALWTRLAPEPRAPGGGIAASGAGEPFTLEDYRANFAHYRGETDLQRSHAAYPWYLMWDDHEFENDDANDRSENADHPRWFRARRSASWRK